MSTAPMLTTDRDALYYPYIHIRDANWLKAALLCFPHVRRMVPEAFSLRDSEAIKPFSRLRVEKDGDPLLIEEDTYSTQIETAYLSFINKIEDRLDFFVGNFSGDEVRSRHGDSFRIHKGKMSNGLVYFLTGNQLAWPTSDEDPANPEWYALHPKLGETIMSVLAIATAKRWGLDIVTSEAYLHAGLASQDADRVFLDLIGQSGEMLAPRSKR